MSITCSDFLCSTHRLYNKISAFSQFSRKSILDTIAQLFLFGPTSGRCKCKQQDHLHHGMFCRWFAVLQFRNVKRKHEFQLSSNVIFRQKFNVAGVTYQWNDGIFSVTLSERNAEGFKTAYFHSMASTSEFAVSTAVLKNQTASTRSNHGTDFRVSLFCQFCVCFVKQFHVENDILRSFCAETKIDLFSIWGNAVYAVNRLW